MFIQSKLPALNGEVDGGAERIVWGPKDLYDCSKPKLVHAWGDFVTIFIETKTDLGWKRHLKATLSNLPALSRDIFN